MKKVLKIKSISENLRSVEKFVDEVATDLSLTDEIYGNLLIATLEAANNAIQHGNKGQEDKEVNIVLKKEKYRIILRVQDQGSGFDYKSIPDPTSPENIEKINGRGVFLMQKLSDQIEFFENGRIVQLTFSLK
ncbi:MAG: ATP-binding protein [Candidatus Paceibacterota bacterium]